MHSILSWKLPESCESAWLREFLKERYPFHEGKPVQESRHYLDTFDRALFSKSLLLFRSDNEIILRDFDRCSEDLRLQISETPVFAGDLPDGPIRHRLQPIITVRALLDVSHLALMTTRYRVLNQDDKTVIRLKHIQACDTAPVEGATQFCYLSVAPVRGYRKHAKRLLRALNAGEAVSSVEEAIYRDALRASGEVYTPFLDLELEPAMPSSAAAKEILRRLFDIMRANIPGIRADTDIEFLHHYRVAIRKTRAALGQMADALPADAVERYRQGFRWLGQSSNTLRDLDVYILAESNYQALLPEAMRDDITPLFAYLRSQRSAALSEVIDTIDSQQALCLLQDWSQFLDPASTAGSAPSADLPIGALARADLHRRYRRIVKRGTKLTQSAEDDELHALRIECKKLRYGLEFFASLYPPKKIAGLTRELKKLQDNLGEFNDLSVQQDYLMHVARQLPLNDDSTARALVATGALIESLAQRQEQVRGEFARRFSDFASPDNQKVYRKLFAK